jgi:hypothetical protein
MVSGILGSLRAVYMNKDLPIVGQFSPLEDPGMGSCRRVLQLSSGRSCVELRQ